MRILRTAAVAALGLGLALVGGIAVAPTANAATTAVANATATAVTATGFTVTIQVTADPGTSVQGGDRYVTAALGGVTCLSDVYTAPAADYSKSLTITCDGAVAAGSWAGQLRFGSPEGISNTGANFTVTVPPPPVDTDGDRVPDPVDKCPDTALGAVVDANGCSAYVTRIVWWLMPTAGSLPQTLITGPGAVPDCRRAQVDKYYGPLELINAITKDGVLSSVGGRYEDQVVLGRVPGTSITPGYNGEWFYDAGCVAPNPEPRHEEKSSCDLSQYGDFKAGTIARDGTEAYVWKDGKWALGGVVVWGPWSQTTVWNHDQLVSNGCVVTPPPPRGTCPAGTEAQDYNKDGVMSCIPILPQTGIDAGFGVALAFALLLAGWGLILSSRRRKPQEE